MIGTWILFAVLSALAVIGGWLVFRFDSMVRATLALLTSFLAVAVLMLPLGAEFLFAITFLMMIGEMMIMVLFMVAFMMNPAGLNPMMMVHQPRFAAIAGGLFFLLLAVAIVLTDFTPLAPQPPAHVTYALGQMLLGPAMLIFETAGVTLLTGMVAVMVLAARRGRFGDAIVVDRGHDDGDRAHHPHHH